MRPFTLAILLLASALPAAEPPDADRTLRTIDFEERRLGNVEDLPMHWAKVDSPAIPHYVNGKLSNDRAHSGQYSFRFDLNGGSLIYRYQPGRIRVQPRSHYRVQTYVQTTPMPHARHRLTAYFVDLDRRIIPTSIVHFPLFASAEGDSNWQLLTVELATDKLADSLVVELELLQPAMYQSDVLGGSTIYPQDIRATAWFDDVSISQVPQVNISTDRPGNIFRPANPLALRIRVADRSTDDLAAQLVVKNAAGQTVFQRSGALDIAAAEILGKGQKQSRIILPALPPGWYEASLTMTSKGRFVGQQTLNFIRLADSPTAAHPDERFGIIATDLPFDGWSELPEILPFLGAGRVKLAVWSAAGDIQQSDPAGFDRLLVSLQELGITPTACLLDLPPSIAKHTSVGWALPTTNPNTPSTAGDAHPNSLPLLLTANRDDWQPQLAYLVSRHANHLDRWQLGPDGTDAFVTDPKMRQVYNLVYSEFSHLIQKPDLAMPWPAWYELDGQIPATVALSVHSSVLPNQLPLYMQDIVKHKDHNLSLTLQLLDREKYGREVQIRDLAQRTIFALSAGANRIDLPLPFTVERDGDDLVKQPQELLMIVRTLTTTLAGAAFKGKVPIAEGVEAFLFERSGQGILAIWDKGHTGSLRQLNLTLGDKPRAIDLWGNVTPLIRPFADGKVAESFQLNVGPMPIFLVDIDARLAMLRASVAIDRPLLESSFKPHLRRIKFTNPWKTAIAGQLHLKAPPGWTISPPTMPFNLNPGETFDKELTLEFPYNSYAGPKTLSANFSFPDTRLPTITVPITLNLGLSNVGMNTLALRDGKDVLVQQIVTNYGEKPIDYTAFAIFPGQPRQERLITNLSPGRTTIKLYRFPASKLEKPTVRTGIKELLGNRILNEEVEIQ